MFDLQKEMKNLKAGLDGKKRLPSPQRLSQILAMSLVQFASHFAFRSFQDKKFRQLGEFEKLSQTEKDRIFNELICANLVLLILMFEAPDLRAEEDLKDYYLTVKDEIPKAHILQLKNLGIENKYLKDWEKLIKMRYDEYSGDKLQVREAAMEVESREKNLDIESLKGIQLMVPLQTVAIGCHHHICRGKTEGKDELFKFLVRKLGQFYIEVRVRIEGGEITLFKRIKVKLRHLYNRFLELFKRE